MIYRVHNFLKLSVFISTLFRRQIISSRSRKGGRKLESLSCTQSQQQQWVGCGLRQSGSRQQLGAVDGGGHRQLPRPKPNRPNQPGNQNHKTQGRLIVYYLPRQLTVFPKIHILDFLQNFIRGQTLNHGLWVGLELGGGIGLASLRLLFGRLENIRIQNHLSYNCSFSCWCQ